jgi:hypothetical protein
LTSNRDDSRRRSLGRLRWRVGIALVAGLAIGPAIVWVVVTPASPAFSGEITTPYAGCVYGCPVSVNTYNIPVGTIVRVTWSDQSGGSVAFEVERPGVNGAPADHCSWRNATLGTCTFTSVGGIYAVAASNPLESEEPSQIVDFQGFYQPSTP